MTLTNVFATPKELEARDDLLTFGPEDGYGYECAGADNLFNALCEMAEYMAAYIESWDEWPDSVEVWASDTELVVGTDIPLDAVACDLINTGDVYYEGTHSFVLLMNDVDPYTNGRFTECFDDTLRECRPWKGGCNYTRCTHTRR